MKENLTIRKYATARKVKIWQYNSATRPQRPANDLRKRDILDPWKTLRDFFILQDHNIVWTWTRGKRSLNFENAVLYRIHISLAQWRATLENSFFIFPGARSKIVFPRGCPESTYQRGAWGVGHLRNAARAHNMQSTFLGSKAIKMPCFSLRISQVPASPARPNLQTVCPDSQPINHRSLQDQKGTIFSIATFVRFQNRTGQECCRFQYFLRLLPTQTK